MYGYIPEEIAIVHSGKEEVYRGWIDLERDKETEVVIPAFPCDPTNKKKMETAVSWATYRNGRGQNKKAPTVVRRKNEPFETLRVLTLEARREGGRAWKVVDGDGFYFDLREDVLLDIMRHCGMLKNAVIKGKFIWAVVGSQTKIVRVGSGLHEELIEATKMHNTKTIANGELTPGDICQSKSGEIGIFLGWVSGKEVKVNPKYADTNPGRSYGRSRMTGYDFVKSNFKKRGLWWTVSDKIDAGSKFLKALEQTKPVKRSYGNYYDWDSNFALKKSHVYRQKIGKVQLPENVIEQVRNLAARITDWNIKEVTERFDSGRYHYGNESTKEYVIAEDIFPRSGYGGIAESQLAWVRPVGEDEPVVTQFDNILGVFDLTMVRK